MPASIPNKYALTFCISAGPDTHDVVSLPSKTPPPRSKLRQSADHQRTKQKAVTWPPKRNAPGPAGINVASLNAGPTPARPASPVRNPALDVAAFASCTVAKARAREPKPAKDGRPSAAVEGPRRYWERRRAESSTK